MEVEEVFFLRAEDGRFVHFWGLEDSLARMRQLVSYNREPELLRTPLLGTMVNTVLPNRTACCHQGLRTHAMELPSGLGLFP
jgi:hypothetical protein